ncbi:MAG: hypothetical protein WC560_13125 [Syntrophales bacterium]
MNKQHKLLNISMVFFALFSVLFIIGGIINIVLVHYEIHIPLSAVSTDTCLSSAQVSEPFFLILIVVSGFLLWMGRRWLFRPSNNIREKEMLISTSRDYPGKKNLLHAGREL